MNKKTTSFLTFVLTSLVPLGLSAQTKVVFAPQTGKAAKTSTAMQALRAGASKSNVSAKLAANGYKSPFALCSESDRVAALGYESATGKKPVLVQHVQPSKAARKADAEKKMWNYTGFNIEAGTLEDGTKTGGLVDFNLQPFECDTVSSDGGLSPYSYMAKGKLYCFLPIMDAASGEYTSMTRTTYDANTLERLDQRTVNMPGAKDRVPYLITYDEQRDVVYAISMLTNPPEATGEGYYLNVLDTATCQLQRVGYLGNYTGDRKKGNFSPNALVSTYSGQMLVQNSDDSLYIEEIDPMTCKRTLIGRTELPTQYVYGLQPMIYDSNSGNLIVNHYDFANGTQYYEVAPFIGYDQKDNVLKTELIENAPTGFNYFYKRPEANNNYYKYQLADISDLKATVDDNGKATVSFTVPSTDDKGNNIEIPSWSNKNVHIWVYVDNEYVSVDGLPSQMKLGDKLSFTTYLKGGMHIITVMVSPMYNETNSIKNSAIVVSGYDAPAMVSNAELTIEDGLATITWDAPTEGRYADFGSKFDASDLTYKVVRDNDGKVIADGITDTGVEDKSLPDEIQTYTYTIYATSHGMTSAGIQTNGINAGKYLAMPYENKCDNAGCLDGYTVLDLDNNGSYRTWMWNSYQNTIVSGWGNADDWLITPKFQLSNDNLYALRYTINGSGDLRTTVGKGVTPEDQDENILEDLEGYTTHDVETHELYFRPSDNDTYNFGLYNQGVGDDCYWSIKSLSVKPVAKASAPDMVRSLQFTPDAGGALGATLSFTVPATAINGNSLSSVSKVTVYDLDGNVLGTAENVAPGASASIKVQAEHGWNDYKVVAANADGDGWPVVIRKFVGPDTPKAVNNLKITWGDDRTIANLSWEAPTEGVNGGYVDPSAYTYHIYKYDANVYPPYIELGTTDGSENSVEVTILDASENQNQYVMAVTASNDQGESDYNRGGIVMGVPYDLPFDEPFTAQGVNHSPWLVMAGKNNQNWTVDAGHYNANIQPQNEDGAQLVFINTGSEDGSGSFVTPIIDFAEAKNPVLSVWVHHSDAMPENAYVKVIATTDGSKDYKEIGQQQSLTGNNGWTEHVFNLSALKGKKAQIALQAYLPNPSFRIFADNWSVREAEGNDLALAAISQPYMPKVGDNADIAVTVTNMGKETANNYSVLFNLNGETIAEQESEKPLALGESATFRFPLAVSAAQKDIVYSAEVLYDADENEDNNVSTEVELSPEQINLPAPTDLALGNDNSLAWNAPETMDGREVMLDFEDQPSFKTDDIKGWKTADLDGTLTVGFVQYYDNYWPYLNQPLAWMTWSANEAGCPTAAAWTPYDGEKCLIAFGNYGADATGRTNNDPVNDWFISPEVKGGTEFSLYALSNEATSTLEIRTSATDDKPESFTNLVKTVNFANASEWTEVKTTLPADAKYVAIRTNNNGFGIMVDNIQYTEAKAPQLKSYNVYNGTELASNVGETFAKIASNGTYAVSAVYDLGESELSNTVGVTTGINDLDANAATVMGGNKTITVSNAQGNSVTVYSAAGQKVAFIVAANDTTVNVESGVYIVKVGAKTFKVNVK